MVRIAQFLSRVNQRCLAIGRVSLLCGQSPRDDGSVRVTDTTLPRLFAIATWLPSKVSCLCVRIPSESQYGFFCGVLQVTSKLKIACLRANTRRSCPTDAPDMKRHAFKARRFGGIRSILFLFFRGLISVGRRQCRAACPGRVARAFDRQFRIRRPRRCDLRCILSRHAEYSRAVMRLTPRQWFWNWRL